jgi:molecular chaperone GrpE
MAERKDTDAPIKVVDRRWWARDENAAAESPEPSGWTPEKPTYIQELEQQLAEKDARLQELTVKYREAQREFDAARARLRKDVIRDVERSRRTLLAELLDVVDNLDRGLEATRATSDPSAIVAGLELVQRQFLGTLGSVGVSRFDALGERFDPARHEAVTIAPAADEAQDGTIVGVIAPGYMIGDEVLRPARVVVAKRLA